MYLVHVAKMATTPISVKPLSVFAACTMKQRALALVVYYLALGPLAYHNLINEGPSMILILYQRQVTLVFYAFIIERMSHHDNTPV